MFCLSPRKCITMIVYTVYIVYYIFFTNKNVNNSVNPINDLMEIESQLILLFRRHLCSLCLNVALPVFLITTRWDRPLIYGLFAQRYQVMYACSFFYRCTRFKQNLNVYSKIKTYGNHRRGLE